MIESHPIAGVFMILTLGAIALALGAALVSHCFNDRKERRKQNQ